VSISEHLAKAAALADTNDWEAAAGVLADMPPTDDVLEQRGWYRSRAKLYDAAIADFQQLRTRRPTSYRPPYMIGYQHYQRQQWADALPYFDEALRHQPDHIKSMWRRANSLERLGRVNEAVLQAGRLLKAWHALPEEERIADQGRCAQASHLIGRHQMQRDPAGAVELFQQATSLEPSLTTGISLQKRCAAPAEPTMPLKQ
jgi:tetratricopeptide (TPR) repeat protein